MKNVANKTLVKLKTFTAKTRFIIIQVKKICIFGNVFFDLAVLEEKYILTLMFYIDRLMIVVF